MGDSLRGCVHRDTHSDGLRPPSLPAGTRATPSSLCPPPSPPPPSNPCRPAPTFACIHTLHWNCWMGMVVLVAGYLSWIWADQSCVLEVAAYFNKYVWHTHNLNILWLARSYSIDWLIVFLWIVLFLVSEFVFQFVWISFNRSLNSSLNFFQFCWLVLWNSLNLFEFHWIFRILLNSLLDSFE